VPVVIAFEQGTERQLLQEDETNKGPTMQPPIWSQSDPQRRFVAMPQSFRSRR
jgi:hypothetical protein